MSHVNSIRATLLNAKINEMKPVVCINDLFLHWSLPGILSTATTGSTSSPVSCSGYTEFWCSASWYASNNVRPLLGIFEIVEICNMGRRTVIIKTTANHSDNFTQREIAESWYLQSQYRLMRFHFLLILIIITMITIISYEVIHIFTYYCLSWFTLNRITTYYYV